MESKKVTIVVLLVTDRGKVLSLTTLIFPLAITQGEGLLQIILGILPACRFYLTIPFIPHQRAALGIPHPIRFYVNFHQW